MEQTQTEKQPSKLKGRKLGPKYKDPNSDKTWAGRGRAPKWIKPLLEQGHSKDEYKVA